MLYLYLIRACTKEFLDLPNTFFDVNKKNLQLATLAQQP